VQSLRTSTISRAARSRQRGRRPGVIDSDKDDAPGVFSSSIIDHSLAAMVKCQVQTMARQDEQGTHMKTGPEWRGHFVALFGADLRFCARVCH
jgi:hypothetical protein